MAAIMIAVATMVINTAQTRPITVLPEGLAAP
jgi:hypothetical protein